MTNRLYVRILALFLAFVFILAGCRQENLSPEAGATTQTITPSEQLPTAPTQMETIPPTTEPGIPQELVQAFSLMHQRLQEGTLRMRIYKPGNLDEEAQILDILIGRDMAGSQGTTVTVVENDVLQNHRELLDLLQPERLIPYATRNNWIQLAYIFETPEDGIILKIGFNHNFLYAGWSDEDDYQEVWEYSITINDYGFQYDAVFYEVIRGFLTGFQQEDYDGRFDYN